MICIVINNMVASYFVSDYPYSVGCSGLTTSLCMFIHFLEIYSEWQLAYKSDIAGKGCLRYIENICLSIM